MSGEEMDQKNTEGKKLRCKEFMESNSHMYACFQQPQTINILKFLSMPAPNKLYFDSGAKSIQHPHSQKPENSVYSTDFQDKKKQFRFQRIYNRDEKFKFAFSEEISDIVQKLFKGLNQSVFIYGTEEPKKDKILIGESQNAGFLMMALSQIFDYCHDKEIEDEITIKLSCSMFKDGGFTDVFHCSQQSPPCSEGNGEEKEEPRQQQFSSVYESMVCNDIIEKKYLLGNPEIIIRNMRTALKIINLISKKIQQRRETKEENTENLIFTIKLEIDVSEDKYTGEVYEYRIPKLQIVKLANPSVDNTLNGVNKNNQWFVNLFNFLQTSVLANKKHSRGSDAPKQKQHGAEELGLPSLNSELLALEHNKAAFTQFIEEVLLKGCADIHCFTSINNKMTSNECLTALIFNNYLSAYKTKPERTVLNINHYIEERNALEGQVLSLITLKDTESQREAQLISKGLEKFKNSGLNTSSFGNSLGISTPLGIVQSKKNKPEKSLKQALNQHEDAHASVSAQSAFKSMNKNMEFVSICDSHNKLLLLTYLEELKELTRCSNLVEYEYAGTLSNGCEKLSKHIINEEIEEYYYAKKIALEFSADLHMALKQLKQQKAKLDQLQEKILKNVAGLIRRTNEELCALKEINGRQEYEAVFKAKKAKVISLNRERALLEQLFQIYKTMAFHYFYELDGKLLDHLVDFKQRTEGEYLNRSKELSGVNYDRIMSHIKKGFTKRIEAKLHQEEEQEGAKQPPRRDAEAKEESSMWLQDSLLQGPHAYNRVEDSSTCQEPAKQSQVACTGQKSAEKAGNATQSKKNSGKYRTRKPVNELDNMFTNSNVGVVRSQFKKNLYNSK